MSPTIEILCVFGEEIRPYLKEIARLRIEVFREFPYLYDGSEQYENDYLEVYVRSPNSIIVLAICGNEVIGASTGLPLNEADSAFQQPFLTQGIEPAAVFYFGESVLKKSQRGQGIGHRFFDERERHAKAAGFSVMAFCAVARADNHPMRPKDYRSNELFWTKRGYHKNPKLVAELSWRQIGSQELETHNQLEFWLNQRVESK